MKHAYQQLTLYCEIEKAGIPEADIDELIAMFEEGSFTREQVKGYLENYRN